MTFKTLLNNRVTVQLVSTKVDPLIAYLFSFDSVLSFVYIYIYTYICCLILSLNFTSSAVTTNHHYMMSMEKVES